MKVQSFISEDNKLVPIEVELTLWPGLPGIQFIGRPDPHLKESALRIKSAVRAQGFQFPVASQVLVNLRPSHIKKTSRGVELAVAAALLWEMEQLQIPLLDKNCFIYGELSLDGLVHEPEDLGAFLAESTSLVITGFKEKFETKNFRRQKVKQLADLAQPEEILASSDLRVERPQAFLKFHFSKEQSEVIQILAAGELHGFLAGPAGSGKTTVARAVHQLLRRPTKPWQLSSFAGTGTGTGTDFPYWRPLRKPHHSTPMISMLGGGNSPVAGEIAFTHGGVLLLDELLEFPQAVREALREPMEDGCMRVTRLGRTMEYKFDAQIIATTNLCPCGSLTPETANLSNCSHSRLRCRAYLPKLSGPFVDRFDFMYFTTKPRPRENFVSGRDILSHLEKVYAFLDKRGVLPARFWSGEELLASVEESQRKLLLLRAWDSHRRMRATLRMARAFADLSFSEKILSEHIHAADRMSKTNFEHLHRLA